MVRVHRISAELARSHVRDMSDSDLAWRVQMYARQGFELGDGIECRRPNIPERSTSVLPGSDARNDDGRPTALNPVRSIPLPESGKEQPGPVAGAGFAPTPARVGEKNRESSGRNTAAGERVFGVGVFT